jgi:hypothetical protein
LLPVDLPEGAALGLFRTLHYGNCTEQLRGRERAQERGRERERAEQRKGGEESGTGRERERERGRERGREGEGGRERERMRGRKGGRERGHAGCVWSMQRWCRAASCTCSSRSSSKEFGVDYYLVVVVLRLAVLSYSTQNCAQNAGGHWHGMAA